MQDSLILVVDDQPGVRRLVQEVLTLAGYRVVAAAHGQEAAVLAATEPPDLALLDLQMPVMDGLETLRMLRHIDPRIVVFIMTAVEDDGRVQEALNSGARGCIWKPFDVFKLQAMVRDVIEGESKA